EVRIADQPEDRQGAAPHDSADPHPPSGPSDRIARARPTRPTPAISRRLLDSRQSSSSEVLMRRIGLAVVPALLDVVETENPASGTMRRRELIAILGTGLVVWPLVARAQQQARSARLGYLGFGSPKEATSATRVEALRAGLRDLGYVESKNLVIEFRWSDTVAQLHEAAAELVRMKVDIIFSPSST